MLSARPYQWELYQQAKQRNVVAYLDTGSGKTLVSVLLMEDFVQPLEEISSDVLTQLQQRKIHSRDLQAQMLQLQRELTAGNSTAVAITTGTITSNVDPNSGNLDASSGRQGASVVVSSGGITEMETTDEVANSEVDAAKGAQLQSLAAELQQHEDELKAMWPKQPQKIILLVPTVPLVVQQSLAIRSNTDLSVGEFSSDVTSAQVHWDYFHWKFEISRYQVLVMTPQICLNLLRHGLLNMMDLSLLIFDECHHAVKNHPFNCIMREFYHPLVDPSRLSTVTIPSATTSYTTLSAPVPSSSLPKIFGMTASPILSKFTTHASSLEKLIELQRNLDCTIVTVSDRAALDPFVSKASERIVEYLPPPGSLNPLELDILAAHKVSPSVRYYRYYVRCILLLRNASGNQETLTRMDRMLGIVQETKNDLGIWCAAQIAESYIKATMQSFSKNRKRTHNGDGVDHSRPTAEMEVIECAADADPLPALDALSFQDGSVEPVTAAATEKSFQSLQFRRQYTLADDRPRLPVSTELQSSDLAPKTETTMRLLREFASGRQGATFRAMIFVSRRSNAKVLSDLINAYSSLLFSTVKSSFITGHGSQSGLKSVKLNTEMNSYAQSKVLNQFRQGIINTLVVTSVAEEGLDIPACNLVIVMDGFQKATSYVQSRGRARNLESAYMVMCQRGDTQQMKMIAKAKVAEKLTRKACQELSEKGELNLTEIYCLNPENDNAFADSLLGVTDLDNPIVVTSTGATLTIHSALDVLNRYCSSLSRDSYTSVNRLHFTESPPEVVEPGSYGFMMDLRLPIGSPLSMFILRGERRLTKKMAMQSVAFKACRLLYERGALNSHLLSAVGKQSGKRTSEPRRKRRRVQDANVSVIAPTMDDQDVVSLDLYERKLPDIFLREHWSDLLTETSAWKLKQVVEYVEHHQSIGAVVPTLKYPLPLYATNIILGDAFRQYHIAEGDEHVAFVLLTRMPLPLDLPEISIFLGQERIICPIQVEPSRLEHLTKEEWELARRFHLYLFSCVMNDHQQQQQPASKLDVDNDDETEWQVEDEQEASSDTIDHRRMYKLLPAKPSSTRLDEYEIDWELARKVATKKPRKKLLPPMPTASDLSDERLQNCSLVIPYNRKRYGFVRVAHERSAESTFETDRPAADGANAEESSIQTFRQYAETKYGIVLKHPEFPLIEVRHAPTIRNHLFPLSAKRTTPSSASAQEIQRTSPSVYLVPEACELVPFGQLVYRAAVLLPSILHRLEMLLLVDELRSQKLGFTQVSLLSLMEACCAPSANDLWNYERFETLGDSILKYACSAELYRRYSGMDEGSLSAERARMVNNRSLFQRAVSMDLVGHLFVTPFFPKQWAPAEILPWYPVKRVDAENPLSSNPNFSTPGYHAIGSKTIADFMEALIAAHYRDGGMDLAIQLLERFGILETKIVATEEETKETGKATNTLPNMVDTVPLNIAPVQDSHFEALERHIDYRFQNRAILIEAFTHASFFAATTPCYQRLEFLGDATLDWLITRHFYELYPQCQPAQLTDIRQSAVNNESFGRLAVGNGLHEYLLHNSHALDHEIRTFVDWYTSENHFLDDPNEMELEGPKVLGDLFESLCGAILVDTGFDPNRTWSVMYPLCRSFFEQHCTLVKLRKHPVREFHEQCHKRSIPRSEVTIQFLDVGDRIQCEISVRGNRLALSYGNSKTIARRMAATEAMQELRKWP